MSEPEPVRIALVGAGKIAASHVRSIAASPAAMLVAVVDPDEAAAREIAGAPEVVTGPDLASVLASVSIDAAIIAAPTELHRGLGLVALDAGLHVAIEKPMASSVAEIRELIAAADAASRVLTSAQVLRFLPTTEAARSIVATGALGRIEQIVERRMEMRVAVEVWWQNVPHFLLNHWGSHSIDLAIDLLGVRPQSAYCLAGSSMSGFEGLDNLNLLAELQGGGRLAINHSFSSRIPRHDLLVVGTDGTLEFRGYSAVLFNGATVFEAPESSVLAAGFDAQLADFVGAVQSGTPPRAAAESILLCHATLEAAGRSLDSGKPESVL